MTVRSNTVTITDTATRLDVAADNANNDPGQRIMFRNIAATSIFVGGSNVAASGVNKGFEVMTGEIFHDELTLGDALYGIMGTGLSQATVMYQGGV